ncbi:MAG TPA: hypothetical protein VLK84_25735 [Longimicrobium sp.]|nr:hypothetical protein [Longimicrobium sp.]
MKKLTLEIETLRVESFSVDAAVAGLRGTVQGAASATYNEHSCMSFCVPDPMSENVCRM